MKNKIREFRYRRNLSQQELADRCGVSRETICRVEKNKANPSLSLAYHIARQLDVTIEELFIPEEEPILQ
ncbi:MAG: helix-turn-helix transcriptional regulator [Bacillota bacterium]|jgi:putative transcriptional regulator